MELLRSRQQIPFVSDDRLVILPSEAEGTSTQRGRPIGDEYYSIQRKLEFMDLHGISASVISSANPWLDFLEPKEQISAATMLNKELADICSTFDERLYGFGILPLADIDACVREVARVKQAGLKGVIMGTRAGIKSLDHPDLIDLWKALEESGLVIFLHPHYGVGDSSDLFGDDSGHVLPLALGFPFETTTAVSRLILSGSVI